MLGGEGLFAAVWWGGEGNSQRHTQQGDLLSLTFSLLIKLLIFDIIHSPVFYLKYNTSETGSVCLQVKPYSVGLNQYS
jgi:hypothetical protein